MKYMISKKAEKGKVYLPTSFAILGSITSAIFLIPAVITTFFDEPIWIPILLFAFSLLGASLIIAFVNCRIAYNEDGFVYKNFFGIKRRYTYDQITAIKENMCEDCIYIGKHRVMIDELSIGGIDFIAFVNKKYKKLHNGQPLPIIRKAKHDIFNGNVDDVFGFIFAYISVSIFILAFGAFLVWYVFFTPSTVDNTVKQQVTFLSYVTNGKEWIVTASDNQIYKIKIAGERTDTETIKMICDGKTVVTTYSKEITPKDEAHYYSVKAILYKDVYLLSFDETNRLHRQEYWPLVLIFIILGVAWGTYVACSIIVGRNPKKFSKRTVNFFFKDGYIKY